MPGKFGSASILFLVDGYNVLAGKLAGLGFKQEAIHEPTMGLGDTVEATTPVGLTKGTLTQTGGFFDTSLLHAMWAAAVPTSVQAAVRILCFGWAGQTAGQPFTGLAGAYTESYQVLGQVGKLTKANATHEVVGVVDHGIILQPLAAFDGDFTSDVYDSGAASAAGGAGYLQVQASFGSFTGVIQDSSNASVWTTLITFSAVTASPTALRATVSGTVKRYLRFVGTVWGNVSPSASISASASTSLSPSSSRSPSQSASSSFSPSASQSASASISPSASVSPSASLSQSVSSSASVSPSTAAGAQGQATVFCGFARY